MILPSPAGLLNDAGPIGHCLRRLPPWMLAEAEAQKDPWRWLARKVDRDRIEHQKQGPSEELNAEIARYEKAGFKRTGINVWTASKEARDKTQIREVRFHYHKHDTNKRAERIIMEAHWPASFRKTLHAAASQRRAIIRLGEAAGGGGSISKSFRSELREALKKGNQEAATHWAHKVAASVFRRKDGRRWLLQGKRTPPAIREHARWLYEQLYTRDVRRLGRKEADEKRRSPDQGLDFKQETASDKIAVQLAVGWLSLPGGFPGYCFLSDEVTANVLGIVMPFLRSTTWKLVRTIRERIGLKKGEIIVTCLKRRPGGEWAALDFRGREWGLLKPLSGAVPPKL
jgi:hypothetical protein